jgi:hypothetical protein
MARALGDREQLFVLYLYAIKEHRIYCKVEAVLIGDDNLASSFDTRIGFGPTFPR